MTTELLPAADVAVRIRAGQTLLLAGDESVLRALPPGRWVAGTIPYFMAGTGGQFSRDLLSVVEIPPCIGHATIRTYDAAQLASVYTDAPEHGFSVIILPSGSAVHLRFALDAASHEGFATRPLVGWVAGVALEDLGHVTPKVVDGTSGILVDDRAVVLHATLPPSKIAEIGIVNVFQPGDGDTITFPSDGFSATDAMVNGKSVNFAAYVRETAVDTRLPLVADMYGAMINTSFERLDEENGRVHFYAPVFRGIPYHLAKPVADYVGTFAGSVPPLPADSLLFSCNCILNYVHANLEGKRTGSFQGPITFGEVAYQLLNQTLVYLSISDT